MPVVGEGVDPMPGTSFVDGNNIARIAQIIFQQERIPVGCILLTFLVLRGNRPVPLCYLPLASFVDGNNIERIAQIIFQQESIPV